MLLDDILQHNRTFVEQKDYQAYVTSSSPDKHAVILTCMDTRLTELLPKAMHFKNGDVKILKTAGGIIKNPYGSVMQSILVAVHALGADEVYVVGHHDCGMSHLDTDYLFERMKISGITEDTIANLAVDANEWFAGFDHVEDAVTSSVDLIKNHPLLPTDTPVHGLVIDPKTGKLDVITNGYDD